MLDYADCWFGTGMQLFTSINILLDINIEVYHFIVEGPFLDIYIYKTIGHVHLYFIVYNTSAGHLFWSLVEINVSIALILVS